MGTGLTPLKNSVTGAGIGRVAGEDAAALGLPCWSAWQSHPSLLFLTGYFV